MSKPFWDIHQFLHDKADAKSGNPLIYSAFWRALTGEQIDYNDTYFKYMVKHPVMGNDLSIKRTPTNNEATSLDEIIGAIYLNLLDDKFLSLYDYRWHNTIYSPKWYRVLQAGIYCLGKHRNFFKTANVRDMHPIAYLVPPHIRHYLNNKSVKKHKFTLKGYVNKHKYAPFFYLWLMSVLVRRNYKTMPIGSPPLEGTIQEKQTGAISQKNICWLVLSDLGSLYWIKLFNRDKNFNDYFKSEDHPIRLYINTVL